MSNIQQFQEQQNKTETQFDEALQTSDDETNTDIQNNPEPQTNNTDAETEDTDVETEPETEDTDVETEPETEDTDVETEPETEDTDVETDAETETEDTDVETETEPETEDDDEKEGQSKKKLNTELHNIFKYNINTLDFDKSIIEKNIKNIKNKKDLQYFFNAVELSNQKNFNDNPDQIIQDDSDLDEKITTKQRFDYLYPHLDDKFFNIKIANKMEFNEHRFNVDIQNDTNFEEEAKKLCNQEFQLAPQQKFIKNFLSANTPYNGVLLFHGLGTGKTCSAIGIAEEARYYMRYTGLTKQILIVASPNVQQNFRLQLFDENKLEFINNKWTINNCAGNNFLDEINMLKTPLTKKRVINMVNTIINNSYTFLGYIEFANLINKHSNITSIVNKNKDMSSKKKNLLIKNKLNKFFNNRLIVIDEIHNIRDSKENSNKLVAKHLYNLVKNIDSLKLVLLSATPMFNDYKEIIFLINLLNINDKRSVIDIKDVFNNDGTFVKDDNGIEAGKELLIRKLNGYISYIKGDNPFIFPYRILPELFNIEKSIKNENFSYPKIGLANKSLEENDKINFFDIYLNKIEEYQEKVYNYIIYKSELSDTKETYKYTSLLKPIEALSIVYPNETIEKTPIEKIKSLDIDPKDLVGKNGLAKLMTYDEDFKNLARHNYRFKNNKTTNIFLRENIKKYSSKISSIIDSIENSKGPIIIYSQFIDGGLIPVALALEAWGFKRYGDTRSLFAKPPVEELDVYSYKPKSEALKHTGRFRTAKYIMITGDKLLSPNKEHELLSSNDSNNVNGENVKIILLSSAGSEGIDFKYIRQVHLLEPWYNINRIEQICGRAIRTCSHKDLPFNERNVKVYMHCSLLKNNDMETVDLYIYRKAEEKAKQIAVITRILKEASIDCHLNYDLTKFGEDKLKELTNNEFTLLLSNGETVQYHVGDKPFSSLCDYMENCDYKCYPNKEDYQTTENEENNLYTYNDKYLETTNSKVIKILNDLYKENYFYTKENLVKLISTEKDVSLLAINNVLSEFVDNEQYIVYDKYKRPGKIINIDNLYLFQPVELDYENTSIYNRSVPIMNKRDSVDFQIPDTIKKYKKKTKKEEVISSDDDNELSIKEKMEQKEQEDGNVNHNKKLKMAEKSFKNLIYHFQNINNGEINYIKNQDNNKFNMLSYIVNFNNKNNNLFNMDKEELKIIIINSIIENFTLEEQTNLIYYVFNTYENYVENELLDDNTNSEIIRIIKNYYDDNTLDLIHNGNHMKAFIFPYKSGYAEYTLYLLKNKDGNYSLKEGEQMDYNRFTNKIAEKYIVDVKNYSNTIGYIELNNKNEFYDFKIKYLETPKNSFSKGRLCKNFHTIQDKYEKFIYEFLDENIYKKLVEQNKLGKYICVIAELFFRNYELNNKHNKKWFFNPTYSLVNKFVKYK